MAIPSSTRLASSAGWVSSPVKRGKIERQGTESPIDFPLEQLPERAFKGLLDHLNFSDLSAFELVSKKTQQQAHLLFMQMAERYGYGVDDPQTAKWCLNELLNQIDLLHQNNRLPFDEPRRLHRFYALHRLSKQAIFQFLSQAKYTFENSQDTVLKIFELESSWKYATDTLEDLNDSALAVNNAAYYKKIPLLEVLLRHNASVGLFQGGDYNSEWGTPLHGAVEAISLKAIPLLLKYNADINQISKMGTPLHVAFDNYKDKRFAELIELLLNHHADPNINDPLRLSPLSLAARAGLPQIVKMLLDHNADVNAKSSTGLTPLDFAYGAKPSLKDKGYVIYRENPEVVSLLLQHGAQLGGKLPYN